MKRRIQPLMAWETLGFEYTGDDDSSRMPGGELDDNEEYSAARPPKEVSSRTPLVE
jgi:hypothetical protein